jgi:hypothetical protein
MMTKSNLQYARAGATAITAALALSPTYAASPKPIIDLSQSPAISGKPATPPTPAKPPAKKIGPVDERTAEIGGGAIVILALGGVALGMRSRRRRRRDEEAWNYDALEPAASEPAAEEPMTLTEEVRQPEPAPAARQPVEATAFARGKEQPCDQPSDDGSDRCPGETWVERAYRGPSPANPSVSLKARLHRAAFFDKREREVEAGRAAPIDPDAGLPEAMVEDQEQELA